MASLSTESKQQQPCTPPFAFQHLVFPLVERPQNDVHPSVLASVCSPSLFPCVKTPFDHNESVIDEIIGYTVAAAGFATQVYYGFLLAFPLNLIFLSLTIVE